MSCAAPTPLRHPVPTSRLACAPSSGPSAGPGRTPLKALALALSVLLVSLTAAPHPLSADPFDGAPGQEQVGDAPDTGDFDPGFDPGDMGDAVDPGDIAVIEAPDDNGYTVPGEGFVEDMPMGGEGFALVPERADPMRGQAAPAPRAAMARSIAAPVVVELFTAQGCSTCPAADALLAGLADLPGVLPLSWHVDYWDYLGWTDNFADPRHTTRQEGYAAAAGERGVYTPQIIVDGQDTLIGVGRMGLLALIDEHASRPPAVMVTAAEDGGNPVIDLTPRAAIPGGVDVLLVRYLPERKVRIDGGENRGHSILYRNIVVGVEKLSAWPARTPLRLTVRPGTMASRGYPADTRHAILVQQPLRGGRPGPILAALRLD